MQHIRHPAAALRTEIVLIWKCWAQLHSSTNMEQMLTSKKKSVKHKCSEILHSICVLEYLFLLILNIFFSNQKAWSSYRWIVWWLNSVTQRNRTPKIWRLRLQPLTTKTFGHGHFSEPTNLLTIHTLVGFSWWFSLRNEYFCPLLDCVACSMNFKAFHC